MKSTGIVRRVDDLGRVAIPKDIRETLHISQGDPLELFVEGENIVFVKHYRSEEATLLADRLKDIILDGCELTHEARNAVVDLLNDVKALIRYGQ